MRSLRERLNAVTSTPPKRKEPVSCVPDSFFMRETVIPLSKLRGIEQTTLEEIRSCDPYFTGDSWLYQKLLFLDTETTGLSGGAGTVAFEIGLGWIEPRGMVIRQYVMRDYHEEGPMLEAIAALIRQFDTIVSFNGKSFDLPLLESRMTMNRIRFAVTALPHFDLLHAARRVYKLRIGRCNLAKLEAALFGVERKEDLPGALVPQRYFDFIKTGEFALLEDVLRHNLQDVQSLAELTAHLCGAFREPQNLQHSQDVYCIGKMLLRTGHKEKGRRCLRMASSGMMFAKSYMALSQSYKKDRDWPQAVSSWQDMIARGEGGVWPYIELAKYHEHIEKDCEMALFYAQYALRFSLNRSLLGREGAEQNDLIIKRIARLKRKLER